MENKAFSNQSKMSLKFLRILCLFYIRAKNFEKDVKSIDFFDYFHFHKLFSFYKIADNKLDPSSICYLTFSVLKVQNAQLLISFDSTAGC